MQYIVGLCCHGKGKNVFWYYSLNSETLFVAKSSQDFISSTTPLSTVFFKDVNEGCFGAAVMLLFFCLLLSLASQVCHSCFRRQAKLHRCAQCKFANYCDRTCQTACWDEHKQECGAIKKIGKAPSENVR